MKISGFLTENSCKFISLNRTNKTKLWQYPKSCLLELSKFESLQLQFYYLPHFSWRHGMPSYGFVYKSNCGSSWMSWKCCVSVWKRELLNAFMKVNKENTSLSIQICFWRKMPLRWEWVCTLREKRRQCGRLCCGPSGLHANVCCAKGHLIWGLNG